MKRMVFFAVSALAAMLLTTPSASARTAVCIPESLTLVGFGNSLCLMAPTPSIAPPFTAVTERNGSQRTWCLFTGEKYTGSVLRVPAFSRVNAVAAFASGRPC